MHVLQLQRPLLMRVLRSAISKAAQIPCSNRLFSAVRCDCCVPKESHAFHAASGFDFRWHTRVSLDCRAPEVQVCQLSQMTTSSDPHAGVRGTLSFCALFYRIALWCSFPHVTYVHAHAVGIDAAKRTVKAAVPETPSKQGPSGSLSDNLAIAEAGPGATLVDVPYDALVVGIG